MMMVRAVLAGLGLVDDDQGMSDVIWYFTPTGEAALYQEGKYVYDPSGTCQYWEDNGWWFAMPGGAASFFRSDNWLFSSDGQAAYYSS